MASYQLDYEGRIEKPQDIFTLIQRYKSWATRRLHIEQKSYYRGENWTIMHLPDRTYWSDRVLRDKEGEVISDKNGRPVRANAMITNPFVANNRVAYGVFHDIVAQKVNTLFHEIPVINGVELDEIYKEQLGYAFKRAGTEASICGYSFVYEGMDGDFSVFNTEDCIPFFDDVDGTLKVLIRFIDQVGEFTKKRKIIAEVYTEDGLIVYEKVGQKINTIQKLTPYKFERRKSINLNVVKSISLSKLPIIMFKNNEESTSDLTPSIRAKIDVIDIVQSGFINNIEDFSDIYWVLKKTTGSAMTEDDYQDFFANISKTKKLFVDEATPEQFSIPHEARSKAVEMLELQIIKESGVIDTEKLTATQLTTVAIKASTMKLEQRVSDFEWFANESIRSAIDIYKEYNGLNFDYYVDFSKLIINNDTERIDNILKIRSDISQFTVLTMLERLGYIDDVQEELKRIKEEREDNISIFEYDETSQDENKAVEVDGGQDTQTNG